MQRGHKRPTGITAPLQAFRDYLIPISPIFISPKPNTRITKQPVHKDAVKMPADQSDDSNIAIPSSTVGGQSKDRANLNTLNRIDFHSSSSHKPAIVGVEPNLKRNGLRALSKAPTNTAFRRGPPLQCASDEVDLLD